jgi:membrane protease YdiL (CAAX protease family)
MLTLVSFVLAGLREELWRAGVLAGLIGLFPGQFSTNPRKFIAVALAAIVFGLGHLPQGWGGVGLTACLGMGLGVIMVLHKSIWEAVFAHGFFNAASFTMLYVAAKYFPGKIPGF